MRKRNAPKRIDNGLEKARALGAASYHTGETNPYNHGSAKHAAWSTSYHQEAMTHD